MALVSTERISDAASLVLNSCGENRVEHLRRGCVRPYGRVDYHILYIVRGACHVVFSEGEAVVPAGRFILFRPGERQEYYFEADSGSFSYYIHFTGRDAEAVLRSLGLWDITVGEASNSRELEWFFSQMIREYSLSQTAHEAITGGLLLSVLGLLARGVERSRSQIDEKKQKRVQRAIERMYADMDKKLSIEALARECNYSIGYFAHLFRAVTGVSAHAYMCRLRIERAKNMLDSTDLSVLEIALAVGCEDQNYFSRFFKEQTGLSPTAYRASRKE